MGFYDFMNLILPIILHFVVIVAVIILIVLLLKSIDFVDKVNIVMDDLNKKVKSLDGAFKVLDDATDRVSLYIDKVTDGIASFILGLFSNKKKKGEEEYEEEEE